MLTAARHSLLIFSLLALFYIYRLGRYFGDSLIAMLATVFFSFDPTFLAHLALVGTDTAGCAGFVGGLYYGLRFCDKPRVDRALVCGLSLGLACSCKLSCVLLIPILILIAVLRRIRVAAAPAFDRIARLYRCHRVRRALGDVWACDQSDAAAGNFFGSTRLDDRARNTQRTTHPHAEFFSRPASSDGAGGWTFDHGISEWPDLHQRVAALFPRGAGGKRAAWVLMRFAREPGDCGVRKAEKGSWMDSVHSHRFRARRQYAQPISTRHSSSLADSCR